MKRHFGTNDGTVPWCIAWNRGDCIATHGWISDKSCIKTDEDILEPDYYCEECIEVYNKIHGKKVPWSKKPLKRIAAECKRRDCSK